MINNPILKGFNPDPSIIRVGDDYYIATSTFEWFPGVQIHHSKDLVNWHLAARPLNRVSQLDLRGDPDSGGVFAPCLTCHDGIFYLVYSDVKTRGSRFMDVHNYLVTTEDILGEWSDPVYLNSTGFDPSLFHDEDGKKWLVSMRRDFRRGCGVMGGIVLQEYDPVYQKLTGPVHYLFHRGELGEAEGPHIYKIKGYYYLIVAQGGTSYNHAVTLLRSKNVTGPYEMHPHNPVLTSKGDDTLLLQKAGHADLVETQAGEWYMVYLCARPVMPVKKCPLGRETAIQKVVFKEDGWLYMENGTNRPEADVEAPDLEVCRWEDEVIRDDFDTDQLNIHYQSLRIPFAEEWISLTERPGWLRIKGKESLSSVFDQSLIARRQQAFKYQASTCVEFEPESFQQMAGLVCFYDTKNFHYLRISHDDVKGKVLGIISFNRNEMVYPMEEDIEMNELRSIHLRVEVDYEKLQFYYSPDEKEWIKVGPTLDATILSDENPKLMGFTGAFVGLCCQDLLYNSKHADFDYFEYREDYVNE